MTAERWKQVKTIFQNVLETAPGQRGALLDEKCAGDAELRAEIASMLRYEDDAEEIFAAPVFNVAVKLLAEEETLPLGARLDNYRIVREIGRGGMGAVYLAERSDGLFDQRVALKIIKRGMDTDQILRRFVMERQILAPLDHPNIARLLDGGTTSDGLPYFVMEYVEGWPVDQYCLEKNLNLTERLQLFRKICAGISYAHQHLVVHRDLKPSNILITAEGEPKLLDFGIAKLLRAAPSDETAATATGARFLTPEYASPEQFAGGKITTQADVYSLGVLLAKLVPSSKSQVPSPKTDEHSTKSARQKRKNEGQSWLGDLRVIVETACHADTVRRYSSVEAFADDIRRLLAGLPVLAQADTFVYRAAKFVRRNAVTVTLAGLAIFALTCAAVFSIWQARQATAAQARAERRFNDVRKLANQVLFDYHDAIEELPNSTTVREKMLSDSLQYLDSLSQEATEDKELLRELGAAYEKVGTIQGNTYNANLNNTPAMLASYRKSFTIRQKLATLEPSNDEIRRELAIAHENLGDGFAITGELGNALAQYQAARQIVAELAARDAKHLLYLARLHNAIANLQGLPGTNNLGDPAGAAENYRQAVEIAQKLYDSDPRNTKYRYALAVYRTTYGGSLTFNGDLPRALEQLNLAQQLAQAWAQDEPDNTSALNTLTNCYSKLSDVYAKSGAYPQALELQKKAVAIAEPGYLADPQNARAREVYLFYAKLADLYAKTKNLAQAETFYLKALALERQTVNENPANLETQLALADTSFAYAVLLKEQNQPAQALPLLEKCLQIYEDGAARDAANLRVHASAAEVCAALGHIYFARNQFGEALANYEKALPVLRAQAEREAANPTLQKYLSEVETNSSVARAKLH